jgi:hypothetical protein
VCGVEIALCESRRSGVNTDGFHEAKTFVHLWCDDVKTGGWIRVAIMEEYRGHDISNCWNLKDACRFTFEDISL